MVRGRRWGSPLLTDAVREVRRTLSRFLSLFVLSALAVAFLSGLRTTAPDMEYTADRYFDRLGLMDIRVLSTLGLTDEDVAALAQQEGIIAAEGSYEADASVSIGDNDLIIKLISLSEKGFNLPDLQEGRLPQNDRECLVEPAFLDQSGLSVGDTVTFDTGDGDYEDALVHDTFTIVGTANSPLYVSLVQRGTSSLGTGSVSAFVMLPESAFSMDAYTQVYLQVEGAEALLCYGEDYETLVDGVIDRLEPLGEDRADLRYDDVIGEANEKLDDAQKEYDDAAAEVTQELADAEAELADARKELDDGWAEWRDGWETLRQEEADGWAKIYDAEAELPDALQELKDGEAELADARKELDDGWKEYQDGLADYDAALVTYQDGVDEYNDGYQTLLDSESEYADALTKLEDGQKEYDQGMEEYRAALQELADGGQQLMDAKQQLEDARMELRSGSTQISQGEAQLEAGKAQYQQLSDGYTLLSQSLGASDPDSIAQTLLMLTMDPTGQAAGQFHTNVVLSLRTMLDGLSQAITDEAQLAMLEHLKAALPADAETFNLAIQTEEGRAGLAQGISGAMAFVGQALPLMEQQLSESETKLEQAKDSLADGRRQYREGLEEYEAALEEYEKGVKEAEAGGQELADAKAELEDGWAELHSGRTELDDGWAELEEARKELEDGQAELDDALVQLNDAKAELEEGEQEYADGLTELEEGWKSYEEGVADLAEAKATLPREIADAQQELNDAEAELNDGEAEYADGLSDYEEGKKEAEEELADARNKLNDARRDISEIEDCQWYILGRDTNLGYVSFQQDAQRIGNLAAVFPVIFFLVAALVCLTTMTRMVEEQRLQIGSLKALGYGKGAIALKYVGYGFAASFTGGLVGLAVGCTLLPWIIFNAWRIIYTMGDLEFFFQPLTYTIAVGAAVLCVTGAALAAVFSALTAVPAQLLRPKAPPIGKRVLLERIRPLWRMLSFSYKITLRNLFRYQRRFWMTVIGIGGCTALIVTAFGLRDSIFDIMDRQFDEIFTYSADVSLASKITEEELSDIQQALQKTGLAEEWMPIHQDSLTAESDAGSADVTLFAVEEEETFSHFVHLRHRLDDDPVTLDEEGAVITEKLATLLEVSVGDTITLDGDKRVTVTVTDIAENYIQHYVYLSDTAYEALYGTEPEINDVMVRYVDSTEETGNAVSAALIPLSGVVSVSRIQSIRDTFTSSLESVDYAVVLIIVCAAALAFVVLYNLTNINITERIRELATLKVLGFYERELSAYIYRENVFLTVFGVAMGMVMGKFLHQWLVLTVEIDMLMFGRTISTMSYVWAAVLTTVFSLLVNLTSRRRLKKIDMVESLKTIE